MTSQQTLEDTPAPTWRGVNHLALVTDDMDETVRFYAGVLGMRLVTTTMAGPMRHYFFEIAPGNTVAFFEIEGAETFVKGAGGPAPHPIQLDHISFNLADEAALERLQARLRAAGTEVTRVVDHGFVKSVYFTDNNGIALEATYWVEPATEGDDPTADAFFNDDDPVPALREIIENGTVSTTPATTLTDEVHEKFSLDRS